MEYHIEKSEVLRYLAAKNKLEPRYDALVDDCIAHLPAFLQPRFLYRIFSPAEVADILIGKDISRHLTGSTKVVLLAATLGAAVEKELRLLYATDMARAVIFDACMTDAIEKVCDTATMKIAEAVSADGLYLTDRFSPGYGDLPLSVQPAFLTRLDTRRRIGLACTDRFLLTPRKSVTALIGAGPIPIEHRVMGCEHCPANKTCIFRKEGRHCEPS